MFWFACHIVANGNVRQLRKLSCSFYPGASWHFRIDCYLGKYRYGNGASFGIQKPLRFLPDCVLNSFGLR